MPDKYEFALGQKFMGFSDFFRQIGFYLMHHGATIYNPNQGIASLDSDNGYISMSFGNLCYLLAEGTEKTAIPILFVARQMDSLEARL